MSDDLVERQMARLSALLSEERAGPGMEEAEPEIAASELGAAQAVGYRTQKPDVQVSVYVFTESAARRAASDRLKALYASDSRVYARTATNGPMIFFAHARIDGRKGKDAEYRLDRILSAFAGDE
jgi:plasmid replication initiation protein